MESFENYLKSPEGDGQTFFPRHPRRWYTQVPSSPRMWQRAVEGSTSAAPECAALVQVPRGYRLPTATSRHGVSVAFGLGGTDWPEFRRLASPRRRSLPYQSAVLQRERGT